MAGLIKKFVIGASVAAGMTGLTGVPALAASLGGASVSGQHLTYCSDGTTTFSCDNNAANWEAALSGDGNIELAGQGSSPDASGFGSQQFVFNPFSGPGYTYTGESATTLTGNLDGTQYTFSSLTISDWFGNNSQFAKQWVTDFWNYDEGESFNDTLEILTGATVGNLATALFGVDLYKDELASLFQRISDPNVAYVNNDGGTFNVGLAGHYLHESGIQLSEVVKVTTGGDTQFLYGFGQASASGVTETSDGVSHSGIYNFQDGKQVIDVPEPSTLLGLMAVGGALAIGKGKKSKKDA